MRSFTDIAIVCGVILVLNIFVFLPDVWAVESVLPAGGSQAVNCRWLWLGLAAVTGAALGAGTVWFLLRRPNPKAADPQPAALASSATSLTGFNAANWLTAGCIHEFNNILCSVQGFADLALLRTEVDGPNRQGLEQIRIGTERATRLLEQLERFNLEAATVQPVALGLLLKGYGKCLLAEQGWDQAEQQGPAGLSLQVRDTATLVQAQPLQVQRLLTLCHRAVVASSANAFENGETNGMTLVLRQQAQASAPQADAQAPRLELIIGGMAALPEEYQQQLGQIAAELGGRLCSRQDQGATAYCLTLPAYAQ